MGEGFSQRQQRGWWLLSKGMLMGFNLSFLLFSCLIKCFGVTLVTTLAQVVQALGLPDV